MVTLREWRESDTPAIVEACQDPEVARWTNVPKVDLITTDGFLLPNAVLEREGLMERKGFPESYDLPALLRFLADVKAGRRPVRAPIYSHLVYDVMANQSVEVDQDLDGVLTVIDEALRAPPPGRPADGHPPLRGRDRGLRLLLPTPRKKCYTPSHDRLHSP